MNTLSSLFVQLEVLLDSAAAKGTVCVRQGLVDKQHVIIAIHPLISCRMPWIFQHRHQNLVFDRVVPQVVVVAFARRLAVRNSPIASIPIIGVVQRPGPFPGRHRAAIDLGLISFLPNRNLLILV